MVSNNFFAFSILLVGFGVVNAKPFDLDLGFGGIQDRDSQGGDATAWFKSLMEDRSVDNDGQFELFAKVKHFIKGRYEENQKEQKRIELFKQIVKKLHEFKEYRKMLEETLGERKDSDEDCEEKREEKTKKLFLLFLKFKLHLKEIEEQDKKDGEDKPMLQFVAFYKFIKFAKESRNKLEELQGKKQITEFKLKIMYFAFKKCLITGECFDDDKSDESRSVDKDSKDGDVSQWFKTFLEDKFEDKDGHFQLFKKMILFVKEKIGAKEKEQKKMELFKQFVKKLGEFKEYRKMLEETLGERKDSDEDSEEKREEKTRKLFILFLKFKSQLKEFEEQDKKDGQDKPMLQIMAFFKFIKFAKESHSKLEELQHLKHITQLRLKIMYFAFKKCLSTGECECFDDDKSDESRSVDKDSKDGDVAQWSKMFMENKSEDKEEHFQVFKKIILLVKSKFEAKEKEQKKMELFKQILKKFQGFKEYRKMLEETLGEREDSDEDFEEKREEKTKKLFLLFLKFKLHLKEIEEQDKKDGQDKPMLQFVAFYKFIKFAKESRSKLEELQSLKQSTELKLRLKYMAFKRCLNTNECEYFDDDKSDKKGLFDFGRDGKNFGDIFSSVMKKKESSGESKGDDDKDKRQEFLVKLFKSFSDKGDGLFQDKDKLNKFLSLPLMKKD